MEEYTEISEVSLKHLADELETSRLELRVLAVLPNTPDNIAQKHWIRMRISDLELRLLFVKMDRKIDALIAKLDKAATETKTRLAMLEK